MKYIEIQKQFVVAVDRQLAVVGDIKRAGQKLIDNNLDKKKQRELGHILLTVAEQLEGGAVEQAASYIADVIGRARGEIDAQYAKAFEIAKIEFVDAAIKRANPMVFDIGDDPQVSFHHILTEAGADSAIVTIGDKSYVYTKTAEGGWQFNIMDASNMVYGFTTDVDAPAFIDEPHLNLPDMAA